VKKRHFILGMLAALALFCWPALAKEPGRGQPARVYAAASLTEAFNEIGGIYAATGHPKPVFVYAASPALARQIEQGAGADVFASADEPWMDYLAERQLIDPATRTSPLSNKLVLIAPSDRPLNIEIRSGFDLLGALKGGKLAMADPESVPAGRYGKAALQNLNVWTSVASSVVRAENVRSALRFVELGEAAAGMVYATDALASGAKVQVAGAFPQASYPHISYPIAAVRGGRSTEAQAFLAFLRTDAAKAVFERKGFVLQ
jgi:molybdate transport system substrate-binding protein